MEVRAVYRTRCNKFNNHKTEVDGVLFDSKHEANRYRELRLLQLAGEIKGLELQPKFLIYVNGKHVCNYIADFRYQTKDGSIVVEDAKGVRTPVFRLKKKLVEACYGIQVVEV